MTVYSIILKTLKESEQHKIDNKETEKWRQMVCYRAKDHVTISRYLQLFVYKDHKRCLQLVYTCMDNSNESEKMGSSDDEVIFVEGNIQQSQ